MDDETTRLLSRAVDVLKRSDAAVEASHRASANWERTLRAHEMLGGDPRSGDSEMMEARLRFREALRRLFER